MGLVNLDLFVSIAYRFLYHINVHNYLRKIRERHQTTLKLKFQTVIINHVVIIKPRTSEGTETFEPNSERFLFQFCAL